MTPVPPPKITRVNDVTVITLQPEHTELTEDKQVRISGVILEACEQADPPRVVIDLTHTDFFGSSFLGLLLQVSKGIGREDEGRFAISGLSPYCEQIIRISRLGTLWAIYPTTEEAVADLGL